jgi:hypothetical protein
MALAPQGSVKVRACLVGDGRVSRPTTMSAKASSNQNSTTTRRRSVHQRSRRARRNGMEGDEAIRCWLAACLSYGDVSTDWLA